MSERIKYFAKNKGNDPQADLGDSEWRGVSCHLPWRGISWRGGGGYRCHKDEMVGERSALMGAAPLNSLFCTYQ